ncbi:MAG: YjgP/YjgQ family permease [Flammeovirgaceae bacterium]|nr:YjgP/YjgQ family permease [Flammeovirgaceae bacterium]
MKILDRYIIKKILFTYLFVALILVLIISVIDMTEKMDKFSANNLSVMQIAGYYMDFIPWITGMITPITVFIAIVYVTSRLASHTEIVAMLSSGISFMRLLFPYFLGSLIIASLTFYFNGWVIPKSNRERLAFELQYFQNKYYFEKRNFHIQVAPDVYLYIQNYNNQSNIGYQFTLEKFNENRMIEKLSADNIQWDSLKNTWTLTYWKRKRVEDIFIEARSEIDTILTSGMTLDTLLAISPKDFENDKRKYDGMTIPELDEHIAKLKFRGATGAEFYEVEKYTRYSAPFTIFVLVFMGIIVSSRKSRGGTGFQIALGFLLSFVFILFFTMSRTFAEAGSLSPWVAAWIPNATFAILTLVMYRFVPR